MKVLCVYCDSDKVDAQPGVDYIYKCRECGEFFEDDGFEIDYLKKSLERKQQKILQDS